MPQVGENTHFLVQCVLRVHTSKPRRENIMNNISRDEGVVFLVKESSLGARLNRILWLILEHFLGRHRHWCMDTFCPEEIWPSISIDGGERFSLYDVRAYNCLPMKSSLENVSFSQIWTLSFASTFSSVSSRLQKCSYEYNKL